MGKNFYLVILGLTFFALHSNAKECARIDFKSEANVSCSDLKAEIDLNACEGEKIKTRPVELNCSEHEAKFTFDTFTYRYFGTLKNTGEGWGIQSDIRQIRKYYRMVDGKLKFIRLKETPPGTRLDPKSKPNAFSISESDIQKINETLDKINQ